MSKTPGKDLVFIASGGRTGTTFFGEVLGKVIGDSFSAHEPDVMGKIGPQFWEQLRRFGIYQMLLGKMIGATGLRPVGHRLLAGQISEQDGIARVRKMRHLDGRQPPARVGHQPRMKRPLRRAGLVRR